MEEVHRVIKLWGRYPHYPALQCIHQPRSSLDLSFRVLIKVPLHRQDWLNHCSSGTNSIFIPFLTRRLRSGLQVPTLITWLVSLATCTHLKPSLWRDILLAQTQLCWKGLVINNKKYSLQSFRNVKGFGSPRARNWGEDKYIFLIVIFYILSQLLRPANMAPKNSSHPDTCPSSHREEQPVFWSQESRRALRCPLTHRKWQKWCSASYKASL